MREIDNIDIDSNILFNLISFDINSQLSNHAWEISKQAKAIFFIVFYLSLEVMWVGWFDWWSCCVGYNLFGMVGFVMEDDIFV